MTTLRRCTRPGCEKRPRSRGLCHTHYMDHITRQKAYGRWESSLIDAEPTRQHVQRLRAAGVGTRKISETAGVTRSVLQSLIHGKTRNGHREPPSKTIAKRIADSILAVPVPAQPLHNGDVPALGTRRRLQALIAHGYSQAEINRRFGLAADNLTELIRGERNYVDPLTERRVTALFRELQLTPGPCTRARNRGKKNGWPLPLDWDEDHIDDPNYQAERSHVRSIVRDPERIEWRKERVAALTAAGYSAEEIAAQLRCTARTVQRDRSDLGLVDQQVAS
ncbi:helix-turn-helix DNA binding domain protein [Gordonia phage Dolores]|uniref:Helix-turn-helix DNA binding protein n=2 Tax=Beenievirus TaxID=3044673 RepID=A0A514DIG3_9CAUD|nr:helix-turn-helix DNA binding protein [Gordonia phage Sekhmet]YP_010654230.1 helix-turn-helix DNA binding domain protein [Gordonia phage Dolores]QDH93400.1 helix-turn-helix DNA binding protein [Gordonia phage Sekhmet]UAJ16494.1 helix-turn-helix DNA binding domain protein [Gordonia phage Dolores]URM87959.1 helix-turn-helix DNA-binding domain protein [Gordonia phage WinkNick]